MNFLDLIAKPFHEVADDLSENIGGGLVVEFGVGDHVEVPDQSGCDLSSSSSWGAQGCQEDDVFDFHVLLVFSVVPAVVIEELSQ